MIKEFTKIYQFESFQLYGQFVGTMPNIEESFKNSRILHPDDFQDVISSSLFTDVLMKI